MKIALAEAKNAAQRDEVPVGAVIVNKHGEIVAKAGNRIRELMDPTAHAEILSIRKACHEQKTERLIGHSIYVTLEPCHMCLHAIINARISKLYYGTPDTSKKPLELLKITNKSNYKNILEIYPNINEKESAELIKKFFNKRR